MRPDHGVDHAAAPGAALVDLIRTQRGHLASRARLEGARMVAAGRPRRRRGQALGFGGLALAGAVALAVVFAGRQPVWRAAPAPSLTYAVDGARVVAAGAIEPEGNLEPRLQFSDGTRVELARRTKLSVRSVDAHGAELALAEGTARVDVVHLPGAHWLIDAGPFRVDVVGTAFTVGWAAVDGLLDVRMDRGSVAITGPLSNGPITLRAGQHLIVRAREGETIIRDADAVLPPQSPTSVPEPAIPPAQPAALGPAVHRLSSPSASAHEWSAELATGDFKTILRQAERRGIDALLATGSSADLSALADAARFEQRDTLARQAMQAQRRRFPRSVSARDSAFLLGRIEEAERNFNGALDWYERYGVENPAGTYASEALGRKMNVTAHLFGPERSRSVADDYLTRFPEGAYAARARALTRAP